LPLKIRFKEKAINIIGLYIKRKVANEVYPSDPILTFYVTLIGKSSTPVAKGDTSAKSIEKYTTAKASCSKHVK
jgi:hypothetical protein